MKLPLVTSYSNLQLRLGYLKIIAALGTRAPTTNEAFERKLSPLFPAPRAKTSALGGTVRSAAESYIEGLFRDLHHERGQLNQNNLGELLTFAKAFGFLHPSNCSVFEIAMALRAIMGTSTLNCVQQMKAQSACNPLKVEHLIDRAFFLIVLITTDLPVALAACVAAKEQLAFPLYRGFPLKGQELVVGKNAFRPNEKSARHNTLNIALKPARRNSTDTALVPYTIDNILLNSYQLIAPKARNQISITNWKEWVTYFEGDDPCSSFEIKYLRMGKRSSFRHHATPRLEFLVDVGLLEHASSKPDSTDKEAGDEDPNYFYCANDKTRRFASFFKTEFLDQPVLDIDKFVRLRAMRCFGETFSLSLRDASSVEALDCLLKAYQAVKRDIGTTPMWTVAVMAALLALDQGILLEIDALYELARTKAREAHAQIRLSGGSRFDGEFLIGISPALIKCQATGRKSSL